jgi:hypothetical protein
VAVDGRKRESSPASWIAHLREDGRSGELSESNRTRNHGLIHHSAGHDHMQKDDLVAKVGKWLNEESGYPLEMNTAAALTSAGFEVVQGDYFPDDKTNTPRELDVTGYVTCRNDAGMQVSVALLVECRSSTEKPWLLFTSPDTYPANLAVVRRSTNENGRRVLNKLQFDQNSHKSPLFSMPSRFGYAVSVAMRKANGNKDHAYEALMGVCSVSIPINPSFRA